MLNEEVGGANGGGSVGFERDVKGLFRESGRAAILFVFDLWSYDDVSRNARGILAALRSGTMPCDVPWPHERIAVMSRWIEEGMAR